VDELRAIHGAEGNRNAAYKMRLFCRELKAVKATLRLDDEMLRCYAKKYQSGGLSEVLHIQWREIDCAD